MLRYYLLVLSLLFAACSNHEGNTSAASTGHVANSSTSEAGDGNFYKRFSGTIGGKSVVVQLHCWNGELQGAYQYNGIGQVIKLRNCPSTTTAGNEYMLTEFVPGKQEKNAEWTISLHNNIVTGTWHGSESAAEFPIKLTEDYPAGSTKLSAFYVADSAALTDDNPSSPKATTTYSYLLPVGKQPGFLHDMLLQPLGLQGKHGDDIAVAIKAKNAAYFEQYRTENLSLIREAGPGAEAFSFDYSSNEVVSILYNDNDWLVMESFNASYTGGAHGNYGSSYTNIDLQGRRQWSIMDMVTDTAALRPILNDAALAYFSLKPGEQMEQRMLVNEVPPTSNVYLTATGLTFVYNPYEIASYADGQIALFIPYKKLMPFLTPAFKARMHLSERAGIAML